MKLLTGDQFVATEEEHNGTMTLYNLHLGWHSVSPSVPARLAAMVTCADASPARQKSRSSMGGGCRGHMHREKPDLTDELGHSTHTKQAR